MTTTMKIGVIGAGAWGTALAVVAARAGNDTLLWSFEEDVADHINTAHENARYLAGIALDPKIRATSNLAGMADRDALLMVTPAQHLRAIAGQLTPHITQGLPVLLCSKGIETSTGKLMTQVLEEALPKATPLVLSGPSFAAEVAKGLPTAVTLAASDQALGKRIVNALNGPGFRLYLSDDLIGTEIGGAVKNVLAIACGIVEGKQLGASARAALTTRGFAELIRLAVAMGAKRETMSGLSGLGDLILTCNSLQSRNMSLGQALGKGESLEEIMAARVTVSEGVHTAEIIMEKAREHGVEMPISAAVNAILHGRRSVDEEITSLLNRPLRQEI